MREGRTDSKSTRTLAEAVHDQLDENSKAAVNLQQFWSTLKDELKARLETHQDVQSALQLRLESLDTTVRQVAQSDADLKRARQGRWGPLSVCERRLELQRHFEVEPEALTPDASSKHKATVVDLHGLPEALEHERKVLLSSRTSLHDRIRSTEEKLDHLAKLRNAVLEELCHCRKCRRADHASVVAGGASMLAAAPERSERLQLPNLADAEAHDGENPNKRSELVLDASARAAERSQSANLEVAMELLHRVRDAEEDAILHCNASDALVFSCRRDGEVAADRVHRCLSQHQQDQMVARTSLERRLRETDVLFDRLEKSLGRAKHRLQGQEAAVAPLRRCTSPAAPSALSTTASSRQSGSLKPSQTGPRSARSPKKKRAETNVEEQVLDLLEGVESLKHRVEHSEVLLRRLATTRWSLLDELRRRGGALRVVESCLKVSQVRVPVNRPNSHSSSRRPQVMSARAIKALQQKAERKLVKTLNPERPASEGASHGDEEEKPQRPLRLADSEEFDPLEA